uniref:Zinc finger protein 131 n=1 Tax=Cynoglossus semilaevis TaxID=244447 RepID=A0A3P8VML2_CYNSE
MSEIVDGEVDTANEYPGLYKVMMKKLNEQRQLDQFTDITLIVDGHQFRAHKAVLAACSQFFHKFFQDFTQEPLVEIEGVSNTAFRHLMEFTYTATLTVAGAEEAYNVWKAAEYLQMQEAINALNTKNAFCRTINEMSSVVATPKGKKRKFAETSNVITETLPTVEGEQVEIEVIGEGSIEVEESGMEDVVDAAKNSQTLYQEETVTASKVLENVEFVEVQISQVDNLFHCTKCDRSFKQYYHLKQHLKTHQGSPDKPHVCDHCGRAYTREGALKQHISTFHFDTEELSRNQKPPKKVHVCEYCKKHFDHFGHFKEHLRKHTGEKPYECPDCHERFARNSTLKCHMAACQNGAGAKKGRKKVYECQVCSSVFNSWEQFKDHLVSHTGDKPNHCTMCDMWFTHPKELNTHIKEVHSAEEKAQEELVIASIQVEQVTVQPIDMMEMEETTTIMMEDGGVTEMYQEDMERLKQAGVKIQVVHVTSTEIVEQELLNSQVEVQVEGEVLNM